MQDSGIVRNRAKIEATVNNARRSLELAAEFGSLAAYVWRFEPDPGSLATPPDHAALMQIKHSREAVAMSKDLRRRGWAFVGPTTVHSFMEAMGLVDDHLEGCAMRPGVEEQRRSFQRPVPRTGG
jgi:DNA-3-methyladenine glycosylase I